MTYFLSFVIGAITAAGGVFLHLSYPPAGLILGLAGTAATFWSVGKYYLVFQPLLLRCQLFVCMGKLLIIDKNTAF